MAKNLKRSAWPAGESTMARRIRRHDWASTPLGRIEGWPQSLKTIVDLMLGSTATMSAVWGPRAIMLYNDAFDQLIGAPGATALGGAASDAFHGVWNAAPHIAEAMSGRAVEVVDQISPFARTDALEDVWFDIRYDPVRDEDGRIAGVLVTLTETTGKALAERRRIQAETALRAAEERQAFLLALSDRMRAEGSPDAIVAIASRMLGERLGASRIVYAEIDEEAGLARIRQGWTAAGAEIHPTELRLADFGGPLLDSLRAGETVRYDDVGSPPHARADLAALDAIGVKAGLSVPLIVGGRFIVNLNVHQDRPRAWTDAEAELAEVVAERIWAAVERARAEEAMRASEAEYRTLFDTMDQGFCIIEKVDTSPGERSDFRYVTANSAFEHHTAMHNVIGKTIREFMPDAEDSIMEHYDEVVRTGQPQHFEGYVSALDLWMEAEVFPARVPGQVAVLFSNISARKRAEIALRDSETRLRALVENLPGGAAFIVDGSLRYLLAEGEALAAAGLRSEDLVGRTLFEAMPPELAADYEPRYRRALAGEPFEVEHAAHGRSFISRGVPLASHDGGARSVLVVSYDITERKKVEAALRESEERFRQFGDASSDVLWIRDAKTLQWEYLSHAFEAIYCESRDRALSGDTLKRWAELILPEDREHALDCIRRVGKGERISFEYRIRHPSDGQVRWLRNTDFPLFDASGRVQRIGGIGQDVTEEKEFSDRLQVLVAELQHRTRNLVAVVRGLSDRTLKESASLGDFQSRFRDRLAAVSRVQDLLSRLSEGERVTFDELLQAELTAHGALDGKNDRVTLDGPSGVRLRSGTVQTFALALHELATNAVKYGALSSSKGHLAVRWNVETAGAAPELHVDWHESGVAMPEPAAALRGGGYGRELIERALPYQLKAKTTYEIGPDGVHCTIAVPVSETVAQDERQ